jgi:hypothetical protein
MIDKPDPIPVSAADIKEIRNLFLRQAAGETARRVAFSTEERETVGAEQLRLGAPSPSRRVPAAPAE